MRRCHRRLCGPIHLIRLGSSAVWTLRLPPTGLLTHSLVPIRLHLYSIIDITIIDMPKPKLIPLPAAAFQILMALADDDLHGYEIMRRVEGQTDGRTRMGPGTLYRSIQTLLDAGFIAEVVPHSDEDVNDERRRYYRLTASGRKAARDEADRLADVLRVARAKKILRGEYV
jgi:DNA-binding PadR family transcriptional regulator